MEPTYKFTGEVKKVDGQKFYRIQRISDGVLGGWIANEQNLSQEGNCWVGDNATVGGTAKVYDNAQVLDDAQVYGEAQIYGNALVYNNARVSEHARVYDNAVVYDDRMDPTAFEILFRVVRIFFQFGHQELSRFLLFRSIGKGRSLHSAPAHEKLHRLRKGVVLYLNEIIQGGYPADTSGKPVPFPVADLQGIMLSGTVIVPGYPDQISGFVRLQVGKKIDPSGLLQSVS